MEDGALGQGIAGPSETLQLLANLPDDDDDEADPTYGYELGEDDDDDRDDNDDDEENEDGLLRTPSENEEEGAAPKAPSSGQLQTESMAEQGELRVTFEDAVSGEGDLDLDLDIHEEMGMLLDDLAPEEHEYLRSSTVITTRGGSSLQPGQSEPEMDDVEDDEEKRQYLQFLVSTVTMPLSDERSHRSEDVSESEKDEDFNYLLESKNFDEDVEEYRNDRGVQISEIELQSLVEPPRKRTRGETTNSSSAHNVIVPPTPPQGNVVHGGGLYGRISEQQRLQLRQQMADKNPNKHGDVLIKSTRQLSELQECRHTSLAYLNLLRRRDFVDPWAIRSSQLHPPLSQVDVNRNGAQPPSALVTLRPYPFVDDSATAFDIPALQLHARLFAALGNNPHQAGPPPPPDVIMSWYQPFFSERLQYVPTDPRKKAKGGRLAFTPAEDALLALGLDMYAETEANQKDAMEQIRQHHLPTKTVEQLLNRCKNLSARKAPPNPVKEWRDKRDKEKQQKKLLKVIPSAKPTEPKPSGPIPQPTDQLPSVSAAWKTILPSSASAAAKSQPAHRRYGRPHKDDESWSEFEDSSDSQSVSSYSKTEDSSEEECM